MKVGVFWRKFRNVELQRKISEENTYDDAYEEAFQHMTALREAGFDAELIEWRNDDPRRTLREVFSKGINIVFNASSLREVAFLEAFDIPYVGSGIDLVATSKATRKKILAFHQLPTPKFFVAKDSKNIPPHSLNYPLFVKPVSGRGSAGISEENIVYNLKDLGKIVDKIAKKIGQPALVEEFIKGREITVGIIGNEEPNVLPILEIQYNSAKTNTYEHKMLDREIINCPADLPKGLEDNIKEAAIKIYKVLNARDFGRIDMILSENGTPCFLEINTFAGLTMPKGKAHSGYMGYMAQAEGMSAPEFIGQILQHAIKRYAFDEKRAYGLSS